MKFSVTLGAAGDGRDPAALAALAALAEAAGWDAFFLEDYLSYRGLPTYDPWVCLAAIAAATTRIRLGTTVTPLPRRQPWELAAQAVAVDHLSGGRLILGVGSGAADDPVFTTAGTPTTATERAAQLDEGLHVRDGPVDRDNGAPSRTLLPHRRAASARHASTAAQNPHLGRR